jgi:hypothetical protein
MPSFHCHCGSENLSLRKTKGLRKKFRWQVFTTIMAVKTCHCEKEMLEKNFMTSFYCQKQTWEKKLSLRKKKKTLEKTLDGWWKVVSAKRQVKTCCSEKKNFRKNFGWQVFTAIMAVKISDNKKKLWMTSYSVFRNPCHACPPKKTTQKYITWLKW